MAEGPQGTEVYDLVRTAEFDVELPGADGLDAFPVRIELFQARFRPHWFRVRIWRTEHYRIQSTSPQVDGRPAHPPSDELILKEWESYQPDAVEFEAETADEALEGVIDDINAFISSPTAWAKRRQPG